METFLNYSGFILLLLAVASFIGNGLNLRGTKIPCWFTKAFIILLISGLLFGIATWPLTYFMAYHIRADDGELWRVCGIPFAAVYFDSEGLDYVGLLTLPAVVGNILFWTFIPQTVLFCFKSRKTTEPCVPAPPLQH